MSMQFGRMKSEMDIARNIRENRDSDIYIYIYIYIQEYIEYIYMLGRERIGRVIRCSGPSTALNAKFELTPGFPSLHTSLNQSLLYSGRN